MADAHHDASRSMKARRSGPEAGAPARAMDDGAAAAEPRESAALVQRCVAGGEAAWEEFLARYGPLIQGVVRRALGRYRVAGAADEEDACAMVFEALLRDGCRALRSFREPYNLPAWLTVLARRQCRAFLEARRIPERGVETLEAAGEGDGVVDALVARETADRQAALGKAVRELLAELPPRDRLLVKLFYFDRKKYREIARMLRMPMGNVGKTLARALEKLKEKAEHNGWASA